MVPSLHLNLGDDWLRIGDPVRETSPASGERSAAHVLGEDGYGRMIRKGLDGLADRLTAI